MNLIEPIIASIIVIGIGVFGIYQYRKTKRCQRAYKDLPASDREALDRTDWHEPALFAYAKPMNKGMWGSAIVGIVILVWALVEHVAL